MLVHESIVEVEAEVETEAEAEAETLGDRAEWSSTQDGDGTDTKETEWKHP